MGIVKVSTDEGISGYSDMETCASVAKGLCGCSEVERRAGDGVLRRTGFASDRRESA